MNALTKDEQTALTLPERAAVALGESANEAKLRELVAKSSGIVSVTNADGRDEAHRAGMVLLKTRTGIRATGKAARDDATKFSKAVIAMEDELIQIIEPEETRVLAMRDSWDEKIAAEKAEKIAQERARTEAIEARIQAIRNAPLAMVGKSSADIQTACDAIRDTVITEELFGEQSYRDKAMEARSDAFNALEAAFDAATEREAAALVAEEARIAEAARIEAERVELAKQRAENEKIANEQAAERQRMAAQQAAQELAAAQLAAKVAANLAAERAALDEQMQLEREKQAKAAAESARVAADLKRQLDEQQAAIAADRATFAREQEAAADAAKREADHPEALAMNAAFDEAMARAAELHVGEYSADHARCAATVAQAMLTNGRSLVQADAEAIQFSLDAYADSDFDFPELGNDDIIEWGKEWRMDLPTLVARLEAFTAWTRAGGMA